VAILDHSWLSTPGLTVVTGARSYHVYKGPPAGRTDGDEDRDGLPDNGYDECLRGLDTFNVLDGETKHKVLAGKRMVAVESRSTIVEVRDSQGEPLPLGALGRNDGTNRNIGWQLLAGHLDDS
jgi:hypothetical protein